MKKKRFSGVRRRLSAGHLARMGTLRLTDQTNGLFPSSKYTTSPIKLRWKNCVTICHSAEDWGRNRFPAEKCVQVTTLREDRENLSKPFSPVTFRSAIFRHLKISFSLSLNVTISFIYIPSTNMQLRGPFGLR